MPQVFILALDGLEHDLVKKWNLNGLLQTTYGKIELSKIFFTKTRSPYSGEYVYVPYTPIIWTSFITGILPEQHGVKSFLTYGGILEYVRNLPVIKRIKGKRKIVWKLGLKPRLIDKRDLNVKTLFDEVKSCVAVDVPAYNELTEVRERLNKTLLTQGFKEFEKEIWKIYEERKTKVFTGLSKSWELFMAYFNIADLMGHIHIAKRLRTLQLVYNSLNNLTLDLKRTLPKDIIFLIVSDHGMRPEPDGTGSHSNHAFYSLNVKTNWAPRNITDFHRKILEWIQKTE